MAKKRKASAYRNLKLPYTRVSKKREKSYVRGVPYSKIVTFDLGNKKGKFDHRVFFKSKDPANIRHNALESVRVAINKKMATKVGIKNYHFKIRTYPHHILRENPLAAGAGADRFSTGMKHSFGKPIGRAARVKPGQIILEIQTNKKHVDFAKRAIKQAKYKLPVRGLIEVKKYSK